MGAVILWMMLVALAWGGCVAAPLDRLGQSTLLTAYVSQHARILTPSGIAFQVTDPSRETVATLAPVFMPATGDTQVRVLLQASEVQFTPPRANAATWQASDIRWESHSSSPGVLSAGAYQPLSLAPMGAQHTPSPVVFRLAPRPGVTHPGPHCLTVTWKLESMGVPSP